MRFSLTLLLPFLALLTATWALPTPHSDAISVRETFESRAIISNDVELDTRDLEDELERRGTPYTVKPKPVKVTAAAQKARKDAVRTNVAQRQTQNAVKKQDLAAAYAKKKAEPGYKPYGKPRSAKKQPANKPGYRADGRKNGFRLPKQPKTPKPDAVKGSPKTEKHQRTQAAALAKKNARIQAGRANFKHAAGEQRKTDNLPNRKAKFTTPGGTQTVTGKDVRTAIFNSHHFANNKVNHTPKQFRNDLQGPANNRQRPLPNMHGSGTEFPVTSNRGGYQGTGNIGTARVITQTKADGRHDFKGVISHDESRASNHPGFNDHFQLHPKMPTAP